MPAQYGTAAGGRRPTSRRRRRIWPGTPGRWCSWPGICHAAAGSSTSQVPGPPAGHPGVQGDDDAVVSGGLGPAHQALGQLPVGRAVKLEKAWGVAELGRRHPRGDLPSRSRRHIGTPVAAAAFAVATSPCPSCVAQRDHPDRRHENRCGPASCPTVRPTGRVRWRRPTSAASAPTAANAVDVDVLGGLVTGAAGHI